MSDDIFRWAVEWRSKNKLSGETRYFLWDGAKPELFLTRKAARKWIEQGYGYIRRRPYLRREPYGWKSVRAVRVRVRLLAEPKE